MIDLGKSHSNKSASKESSSLDSQILTVSSDFWRISIDSRESDFNADEDVQRVDFTMLENKPLEADKKSYLRAKIFLVVWFISATVILIYIIYFVYLIIEKLN